MNKFLSSVSNRKFSLFCFALIAGSIVLKLFFMTAPAMPRDDDLYYWLWFQHPFFSYPDHPPLIGYLVGLSTLIFGHNSFAITFGGFLLYLVLIILSYFLAKNLFSPPSRLAGVFLATTIAIVPYFAGIAVIMSPDTLMVFFSFLALFAYHHAFFRDPNSLAAWLVAGTLLALALFSKLTVFFIGAAIFLYAFASKDRRSLLFNYRFYLSFIPPTIIGITLLISDASHDWIMLKYGALRSGKGLNPKFAIEFTLNQFLHYSPLLFPLCVALPVATMFRYFKNQKHSEGKNSEEKFFFAFIAFFCLVIVIRALLTTRMLNHWSGFFIVPAMLLVIYESKSLFTKPWFSKMVVINFSFIFFYCALIAFHTNYGVFDYRYDETRNDPFKTYNVWLKKFSLWFHEKTGNYPEENSDWYYRYDTIKNANDTNSFAYYYKREMQKDLPIITLTFRSAVYIEFFLRPETPTLALTRNNFFLCDDCAVGDNYSLYDLLVKSEELIGQDFYLLAWWSNRDQQLQREKTKKWLVKAFENIVEIKIFESKRYGKTVGNFTLYKLENYKGKEKNKQP